MKVPFHLRRSPGRGPAVAFWLPGRDVDTLLGLCSRLGLDPSGRVHDVSGGFVVRLDGPDDRATPGAVRLRAIAGNLYVPVDAELVPALLDDEASGLTRDRGLVFLPDGRALAFDPRRPIDPAALIVAPRVIRRDWKPLPERQPLADRLFEIVVDRPEETAEDILDEGDGSGLGSETPRPEDAGPASTAIGKAALGAGKGLARLGRALGSDQLAAMGAGWVDRALKMAPRLGEELFGRQAAALNALLKQFRDGDIEQALRRALPLATPGESRGADAHGGDRLPTNDLRYDLNSLIGGTGSSRGSYWLGGQDVLAELTREYRKAAEEALKNGDYRRAAAIYGKLLRDYRSAAHALLRGGLNHDAGVVFLAKLGDKPAAARAFEAAGETDRAVALYTGLGLHEAAGDLLRKLGEHDAACEHYQRAAEQLMVKEGGHLAAGVLLLDKARRPDLANRCFEAGWAKRPAANSVSCALRLMAWHAEAGDTPIMSTLVDEADAHFATSTAADIGEAGRFYNGLADLARNPRLESTRDDWRDRALLGLAAQLRRRARPGERGSVLISSLLDAHPTWDAATVSDASFAVAAATRGTEPPAPSPSPSPSNARVFRAGNGVVTAVTSASRAGVVFVGFESGEVVAFRAETSEIIPVASYQIPVTDLATDPDGDTLVILRGGEAGRGLITAYARASDGSYRVLLGMSMEGLDQPWLTPVCPADPDSYFGLWDGESLHILSARSMTSQWSVPVRHDGDLSRPEGGRLETYDDQNMPQLGVIICRGRHWFTYALSGEMNDDFDLFWRPARGEQSSLRANPVSATSFAEFTLDLAGIDENGTVGWARIDGSDPRRPHDLGPEVARSRDSGYLAAAIVRDRLVVGVKADGVHWLRCGPNSLTLRQSTPCALANPVAAFASVPTGEIVIVGAGGVVTVLPVPV